MKQLLLPFEAKEAQQSYETGPSSLRTSELVEGVLDLNFSPQSQQRIDALHLPSFCQAEFAIACPELTKSQVARLMIAIELGKRIEQGRSASKCAEPVIASSTLAVEYCRKTFRSLTVAKQEEFHIVSLNTKNRVIATHQVTVGTLDSSLVHPREVFRPAIADAAASIIGVHNHPSGDPEPSDEDRVVTRRLSEAGKTIGIDFLDHIVVAKNGSVSLRDIGVF